MDAAVQLHQLAGDVQAEPVPQRRVAAAVELMEALEDLAPLGRAAMPGPLSATSIRATPSPSAPGAHARQLDPHPALRRRELERVRQQVEEHLLQAGRVDLRRHGVAGARTAKSTSRSTASVSKLLATRRTRCDEVELAL